MLIIILYIWASIVYSFALYWSKRVSNLVDALLVGVCFPVGIPAMYLSKKIEEWRGKKSTLMGK